MLRSTLTQKILENKLVQKITILGGSGFVGTNLCRQLLAKQCDFEIIDLKMSNQFPEKCKIGDVRDLDKLRNQVTGNIIINLAAVHRDDVKDKTDYQKTNVDGAKNIVKVCIEKCISKVIFTSSVAVYGFAQAGTGEDGEINPFNEYGRTKFAAEKIFEAWYSADKPNRSLLIIRPTVIFGEGNRGNVYNLLNQIASGRFLMIGRGENKKSMAYIANVVAFLETCIASKQNFGLFNYVDTPDLNMNDLIAQVRGSLLGKSGVGLRLPIWFGMCIGYIFDVISIVTKKTFPVSSIRVKKFVSSTYFTSSKAQLNGFKAPYTLSEGIQHTLVSEFLDSDPKREIFYTE